jgi:hypothetical protein
MANLPTFTDYAQQYLRTCTLVVSNQSLGGLDLSQLRIKFAVKASQTETPNIASIRVYNLEESTALLVQKEFNKVVLQAGYQGNYGVIFQGNIIQVILGRESATETFIDIIAGDGDKAYNFAVVTSTIAKGSTQQDQINAAIAAMSGKGVTAGQSTVDTSQKLPRGKVLYGNARNYLRDVAQTAGYTWSIQNEKVNFIKKTSYLPGTQILITAKTGMIGAPQQTNQGVNVKCLLNPNIVVGGRILLDNSTIQQQALNLEQIAAQKSNTKAINELIPRRLNPDGSYYVLTMEHSGDTRGVDWYSSLICLSQDVSANPRNSVGG